MSSTGRLLPALPTVEAPPSSLRGRRYGEDRLYLLVRDPHTALAVWELTAATHARGIETARERGAPVRYQIRIERRADSRAEAEPLTTVNLPDALGGERWYVKLTRSGGEGRARLGIELPDGFQALLESSWVPIPPEGACAEEGAWDLPPEARAWLLEQARAARDPSRRGAYSGRFAPAATPEPPHR